MNQLATLLRDRRLALRLTQRQAAQRAGISLATWQSLERATSDPATFQDLTLSCAAHGLDLGLTEVFHAAERNSPTVGSTDTAPVDEIDELLGALDRRLRALAGRSAASFRVAYATSERVADHLIELHDGKPTG